MVFRVRRGFKQFNLKRKENIGLDKTKKKKTNIQEKTRKYRNFDDMGKLPHPYPEDQCYRDLQ
jgi:hypothetical protein